MAKAKVKSAKASKVLKVAKADAVKLFKAVKYPTADTWPDAKLQEKLNKIDKLIDDNTKIKDKDVKKLLTQILTAIGADQVIELEDAPAGKKGKVATAPVKNAGKKKAKVEEEEEEEDDDEEEEESDEDDEDDEEDDEEEEEESDEDDEDDEDDEEDDEEEDSEEEESDEDDEDSDDEDDSEEDDSDDDDSEDEDEDSEDDEDDSENDEDDDVEEATTKKNGKKGDVKKKGGKDKGSKSPVGKPAKGKNGKGVIVGIVEILANATSAKPISKKAILKKLVKNHPEKKETALWSTLNTQLPNKLKVDKGLTIGKNENGYWIDPKKNAKVLKTLGVEVG